jgi:hypothetical protein
LIYVQRPIVNTSGMHVNGIPFYTPRIVRPKQYVRRSHSPPRISATSHLRLPNYGDRVLILLPDSRFNAQLRPIILVN